MSHSLVTRAGWPRSFSRKCGKDSATMECVPSFLFYMYYSVAEGGLGFDKTTAASIMSIYGSLVYLSSVIGGFLSDRVLGSRKTVFIGGILIMFGHIALATPFGRVALFVSIALIVIGTGLLKPNVSGMVGDLYGNTDPRRDAGFSIFVFGINMGAFIAPIAVGYLGQNVNFHLGFSLAAIGMFFGLVQYVMDGKKYLSNSSLYPSDPIEGEELKKSRSQVRCRYRFAHLDPDHHATL